MSAAFALIFFVSGAAALVFETLWFHEIGLLLGNSVWSSSIVLTGFMAGLGLGNGLAARLGGRAARPARLYALLEAVVGVTGCVVVLASPRLTGLLAPLLRAGLDSPSLLASVRLGTALALLIVPTTAMGATLPLLVKACGGERFGETLGLLYGANTAGAVAGALLSELVLLERLGVRGTAAVAAGLNLAAALGALVVARTAPEAAMRRERTPLGAGSLLLLGAGFGSGFAMLALEVVWFRFLLLFVAGTSLTFALMLAVVLAGIGAGGLAASAVLKRDPGAFRHASASALLGGALVAVCYPLLRLLLGPAGPVNAAEPLVVLGLAMAIALPAAVVSGMLFTFLGSAFQAKIRDEARATGLFTLANTAGATLGSAFAGFVLLPRMGVEVSVALLALAYLPVSLAALPAARGGRRLLAAAAVGFAAALALFPFGLMEHAYVRIPAQRFEDDGSRLEAFREGLTDTLLYLRKDAFGEPLYHRLVTNSFSMSATNAYSTRYMKLFVWLPVALRPAPADALQISFGVGMTAQALVGTRSLSHIDVVDLSPEILQMRRVVFPDPATDPLRDPRVTVHVEDGRFFLQTTRRRYDLITGEPPPPKVAGVVNLYSREFFALVHARLRDGGIASYWLPIHNLSEQEFAAVARAFCGVFSDCSLFQGERLDWILVGTRGGGRRPSEEDFSAAFRDGAVAPEMARLGIERPEQMGALFLADAAQLRSLCGRAEPVTDDFPRRISSRAASVQEPRLYAWLRDPARARAAFAASAWAASTFPASLRERILASFPFTAVFDRCAGGLYGNNPGLLLADIDFVLERTPLEKTVVWMLCEPGEVALAERSEARGERSSRLSWVLGARDLGRRDFASAARRFREARTVPENPDVRLAEAYALARSGDLASASAALGPLPQENSGVRFLIEKMHVPPPAIRRETR